MDPFASLGPSFCILPWIHLCSTPDGIWCRCGADNTTYYDYYEQEREPEFSLKADALGCVSRSRYARANPGRVFGLEEAFNCPNMRRTRLAMLEGRWPDACRRCYEDEYEGLCSYRQRRLNNLSEDIDPASLASLVSRTAKDGSLDAFPILAGLCFGNLCNLACIMCSFPNGSRSGPGGRPPWLSAHINPIEDDEQFWASLARNSKKILSVGIGGGEPFLQRTHFRILDTLLEAGAAAQIRLDYTSNLTVLPEGLFERFSRFKHVRILASCDGIGETFEKIRVGARWEEFVRNLRLAKGHAEVVINPALQRDNLHELGRLMDFAAAEGVRIEVRNYVRYPEELSVRSLPVDRKAHFTSELNILREKCAAGSLSDVADGISGLIVYMNLPPRTWHRRWRLRLSWALAGFRQRPPKTAGFGSFRIKAYR